MKFLRYFHFLNAGIKFMDNVFNNLEFCDFLDFKISRSRNNLMRFI